ncbi:MAG: UvrD-helicase domain-containing protein, partial [Saezia sp.]
MNTAKSQDFKPAYTSNGKPVEAADFYAIACDPKRTVAIEACAGAGKTWMLVSRILRALLEGVKPESILAITYTKKAAGEMRERLFEWLRDFAHEADDAKLIDELVNRGIAKKDAPALLPRLRALHGELLNQSRSVEIRTFHSWFAQMLGAAPLGVLHDLGLPVQYDLIEDDAELFEPAWYALLQRCTQDESLKSDLDTLLQQQGTHNTQAALRASWSRRLEFGLADAHGVLERSVQEAEDPCSPCGELLNEAFVQRWLGYAKALGQEEKQTPQKAAGLIEFALTSISAPEERLMALRHALFVRAENRLSNNLVKFEVAQLAEAELVALLNQHTQYKAYHYQQCMIRLTRALLEVYAELKRAENLVDMSDLERVALRLLGDTETYGWVAQRLDARMSQVLIDEFQDTNPLQWQALRSWLSAYGGTGGGGRMNIFIVGDPKQSIYRFRRADPTVFIAACDFLQHTLGGYKLACDHTRRNAPEVMQAVNAVFTKVQEESSGQAYEGFRPHTTAAQASGEVARLPMVLRESKDKKEENEAASLSSLWRDSLTEPRYLEEEKLRMQEMRQVRSLIQQWTQGEDKGGKGWKFSDIKVLSRRKERLRELLVELNQHRISWRFADDVQLSQTLEVQDLIALLDVLASPTHDLSLAQVLRSPIFGHDDEALMLLAMQVKQTKQCIQEGDATRDLPLVSWWHVLMQAAEECTEQNGFIWPECLRQTALTLKEWKKAAQYLPPHDLLDKVYHEADVLANYAKAVPLAMREGVLANLRAFLQQALLLNSGRYATPYNFVRTLRNKGIKSEYLKDSDAVELLTIHGAKGLEARGIIILDTDPLPTRAERLSVLMDWPAEEQAPTRFIFYTDPKSLPQEGRILAQKEDKAEQREELNALYVAMTRAREKLVFSALQPSRPSDASWWQHLNAVAQDAGVQELGSLIPSEKAVADTHTTIKPLLKQLYNTGPEANAAEVQAFSMKVLPA